MLEYLVHVPMPLAPTDLSIATISVPDDVSIEEILVSDLPTDWRASPAPTELAVLGSEWTISSNSLILRVPSAVVKDEHNILLNPMHSDMSKVSIVKISTCDFDKRLRGSVKSHRAKIIA